jgi:hypothetical protein
LAKKRNNKKKGGLKPHLIKETQGGRGEKEMLLVKVVEAFHLARFFATRLTLR